MTEKPTLLVGITRIGSTPNLFEDAYKCLIDKVSRRRVGLPETEDIQTLVFCRSLDDPLYYWTFSMGVNELKQLRNNGTIETPKCTIKFWQEYDDSNEQFFDEQSATSEQSCE